MLAFIGYVMLALEIASKFAVTMASTATFVVFWLALFSIVTWELFWFFSIILIVTIIMFAIFRSLVKVIVNLKK